MSKQVLKYSFVHFLLLKNGPCRSSTDKIQSTETCERIGCLLTFQKQGELKSNRTCIHLLTNWESSLKVKGGWRAIGHASTCLQTENLHWRWRGAEEESDMHPPAYKLRIFTEGEGGLKRNRTCIHLLTNWESSLKVKGGWRAIGHASTCFKLRIFTEGEGGLKRNRTCIHLLTNWESSLKVKGGWRAIGHASTCLQTENLHWRWRGAEEQSDMHPPAYKLRIFTEGEGGLKRNRTCITCLQTENLHWRWRGAEGAQTDTRQTGSENWLLYKLENDWNLNQENRINSLTHGILQLFIIYHFFFFFFFWCAYDTYKSNLHKSLATIYISERGVGGEHLLKQQARGYPPPPPPPPPTPPPDDWKWETIQMMWMKNDFISFYPGTILKRLKMWHYLRFVL